MMKVSKLGNPTMTVSVSLSSNMDGALFYHRICFKALRMKNTKESSLWGAFQDQAGEPLTTLSLDVQFSTRRRT